MNYFELNSSRIKLLWTPATTLAV